jgi:tRNA-specific 2-thiouridylase
VFFVILSVRVLVAMSGGVDSSITAALLVQQGHEVVGMTMKTWSYETADLPVRRSTGCCNLDDINDARAVAVRYGFAHYVADLRETFGEKVIDHFVESYLAGLTPNPCILCNTYIKWEVLFQKARQLHCEKMATGHYAQIGSAEGRYFIRRAEDLTKDQSYVLWGLSQEMLTRTLFPLGTYPKAQVRAWAADWGFERLSQKKDSYEICFVPTGDYRTFLHQRRPAEVTSLKGGPIIHIETGAIVGAHEGYPFYTIGQRRGLPALGKPHYVVKIDPAQNILYIGPESYLYQQVLHMHGLVWHRYPNLPYEGYPATVKIRHMDPGHQARLYTEDEGRLRVEFLAGVKAITPGQAAVAYEGDTLLVGGWIIAGV